MLERFVYNGSTPLIHGQTYNVNNFTPLLDTHPAQDIFVIPPIVNDHSNMKDCLTLSNHRVFMKRYSHLDGVYNLNCNDSVGVAIRLYLAITHKDLYYDLQTTRYAIDNDDLKNMQEEWEQKEISRIINEIKPLLNREVLEKYISDFNNIYTTFNRENFGHIISTAMLELALKWSYNEDPAEQLPSDYFIPFVEDIILLSYCKEYPLLTNRDWHCTYTHDIYLAAFA